MYLKCPIETDKYFRRLKQIKIDDFYLKVIFHISIVFILYLVMTPMKTSLFSGSGWRNTQTFAAYDCFKQSKNFSSISKCFIAPKLGFNDKHYVGLESPILQLSDLVLSSKISIYTIQSKTQLIALILIFVVTIIFLRWQIIVIGSLFLYFASLLDNPTLSFFLLSYQPDLLSMGLIFTGVAFAILDTENKSFIPEILLGIGLVVKPQHAPVGALSGALIRFRYLLNGSIKIKKFIHYCLIIVLPIGLFIFLNQVTLWYGIGDAYPSLFAILGGFNSYSSDHIFENFFSMFKRNGVEYLIISVALLSISIFSAYRLNKLGYFLSYIIIIAIGYILTYSMFLTGFIVNIYYGSILFITINCIIIFGLSHVVEYFENVSYTPAINLSIFLLFIFVTTISYVGLLRPKSYTEKLLLNRETICIPNDIEPFSNNVIADYTYINNPKLEPTIRTALGKGQNIWFESIYERYHSDIRERIENGEEAYYYSCGHFTTMLKNNAGAFDFLRKNADTVYANNGWIVWKFK